MTSELADPATQIERECETDLKRRSLALTYAFAIRQIPATDGASWARINTAIREKFGAKGAEWIKTRAWAYVDGTIQPGSKKDRP